MGFRPVYQTYVDMVIEHLGGKSFRETAEEELLYRFQETGQQFFLCGLTETFFRRGVQ